MRNVIILSFFLLLYFVCVYTISGRRSVQIFHLGWFMIENQMPLMYWGDGVIFWNEKLHGKEQRFSVKSNVAVVIQKGIYVVPYLTLP